MTNARKEVDINTTNGYKRLRLGIKSWLQLLWIKEAFLLVLHNIYGRELKKVISHQCLMAIRGDYLQSREMRSCRSLQYPFPSESSAGDFAESEEMSIVLNGDEVQKGLARLADAIQQKSLPVLALVDEDQQLSLIHI